MNSMPNLNPDELKAALQRLASGTASDADRQLIEQALLAERIVVAASERSVAVGGDVIDSVIVTGDVTGTLLIFKGSDAATIRGALQTIATRPHPLSAAERAELDRAYLTEVIPKYEFWRDHYTPLAAIARLRAEPADVPTVTPREFLPRGFDILLREKFKPEREPREEPKTEHYDDLRDAIERHGNLVLLGEPGAGKTTTLWRLMYDYALRAQSSSRPITQIPILISLGRYDGTTPILDFVRTELVLASRSDEDKVYPAHRRLAAHLEEYLEDGGLILLFDALNEMPQKGYTDSARRFGRFLDAQRGNRFIFTCRALDYTVKFDLPEATIQELDEHAQHDFLNAYFTDVGERLFETLRNKHKDLLEIGRNPYMLLMIGQVYQLRGELPPNRGLLFQSFVNALMERERKTHPDRWMDAEILIHVLSDFAFAIQREHGRGTSVPREWANLYLTGSVRVNGREVAYNPANLLHLGRSASLLDESADGSLRFMHQLLQEYFAAVALLRLGVNDPQVHEAARYYSWDETLILLAGLVEDATPLVKLAMAVDPYLAARCVSGARSYSERCQTELTGRLLDGLTSRFSLEREEAIKALGCLKSELSLRHLINALSDEDDRVHFWAIEALREIKPDISVNAIASALKSESWFTRISAVKTLGNLRSEATLPYLLTALQDTDDSVRKAAVKALTRLNSEIAVPALFNCLRHQYDYVQRDAVEVLGEMDPEIALPYLVSAMKEEDYRLRMEAVKALGELKSKVALSPILVGLQDENSTVRAWAVRALGELGLAAALNPLLAAVEDKDQSVRAAAAEALGQLKMEVALPKLLVTLSDKEAYVRSSAATALGQLGSEQAVPHLLVALDDNDYFVRHFAARALATIHSDAARKALSDAMRNKDWKVRVIAAEALYDVELDAALSLLSAALKHEDDSVRCLAVEALGKLQSEDALVLLMTALNDEMWYVRKAAVEAVGGFKSEQTTAHLVTALNDANSFVRQAAIKALEGTKSEIAVRGLSLALEDDDFFVRWLAIRTLAESESPTKLPELLSALRHSDWAIREGAANGISELESEAALPSLLLLLRDWSSQVRAASARKIEQMIAEKHLPLLMPLLSDAEPSISNLAFRIIEGVKRRLNLPKDYQIPTALLNESGFCQH